MFVTATRISRYVCNAATRISFTTIIFLLKNSFSAVDCCVITRYNISSAEYLAMYAYALHRQKKYCTVSMRGGGSGSTQSAGRPIHRRAHINGVDEE